MAEDILQSPVDDDNISVASAFSQRSEAEDDVEVRDCCPIVSIILISGCLGSLTGLNLCKVS